MTLALPVAQTMRARLGMPVGLQSWRVSGQLTGDLSAGGVVFNIGFNPSGTLRRAYSISDLVVAVTTAGLTYACDVSPIGGEWLEAPQDIVSAPLVAGAAVSAAQLVSSHSPNNLGAVVPGTEGRVQVNVATNVNGQVYRIVARGLMAESEFVHPLGLVP